MSTLLDIVNDYRRRLMAGESQAEATLNAFHVQTLVAIQPALDRLYQQMTDALAKGQQIDVAWLMEANRLELVKKLISGQIDQFGALALATTGRLQQNGVLLGQDAALAMLRSTLPPGVSWSFGVPSHQAIQRLVGATQAGSPLATLFRGFGAEAAELAERALITGITLGHNPRQIAPMVKEALGVSRNRALVISRQESLRCYRDANLETLRQNSDVLEGWEWLAARQKRTCAVCLAMDGTIHDLSEDFASHVQCRCTPVPVSRGWSEILGRDDIPDTRPRRTESGSEWFSRQSEETQKGILGKAKFDAFKDGSLTLQDLVGVSHSKDWGKSRYEKSLKDAIGGKNAKQYQGKR